MKIARFGWMTVVLLSAPLLAHAQGGCVDSPEAPTGVLLLVGGVGVALQSLRAKLASLRRR